MHSRDVVQARRDALTRWVFETCLTFGTTLETAHAVACQWSRGMRVDGIVPPGSIREAVRDA